MNATATRTGNGLRLRSLRGLAWRGLTHDRARAVLSVVAVSFGVAITIAGSMVAQSIRDGVLKSDEIRSMMEGLVDQVNPLLAFVGVVITLAAGFLIFNAFAMSITRRRQEIGSLRALGLARGQVMRLLGVEALTVAVLGTLLGLAGGPFLGQGVIVLLRRFGGGLFAFEDAAARPDAALLAVALGLIVPLLAVLLPARSATRISPLAALRPPEAAALDRNPTRRAWIGLALIAALAVYLVVAPPGAWVLYPLDWLLTVLFVGVWFGALGLVLATCIGLVGTALQRPLTWIGGATGRLIADNLRRGRGRVMLTVLTLALTLAVISGLSGFLDFMVGTAFTQTMDGAVSQQGIMLSRVNIAGGWEAVIAANLDSVLLTDDEVTAIEAAVGDRANLAAIHFTIVPELSFLGSTYFSYVVDPLAARQVGETLFGFTEGNWASALPVMQAGCGVLVAPVVAIMNGVGLGDTFPVTGPDGPLDCTIAGIGHSVVNASVISSAVAEELGVLNPAVVLVIPHLGADMAQIEAALRALTADHPLVSVIPLEFMLERQLEAVGIIGNSFSGLLLLAILAAALGVVNTTLVSVHERRREFGLLRAVGSTRRQVRALVMGEATLMGLVGGLFGLVAGAGFVLIFVVTYGGNSWGITFDLWQAAFKSTGPAVINGLVGLIAAPVVAALAAWGPTRRLLREKPVETLALR
ncbi:MAG: FtsX-like permease family protein [Anaerolineae bacterium]|nr:FtsX-like permease family protein [Anaerolineae bacterium]